VKSTNNLPIGAFPCIERAGLIRIYFHVYYIQGHFLVVYCYRQSTHKEPNMNNLIQTIIAKYENCFQLSRFNGISFKFSALPDHSNEFLKELQDTLKTKQITKSIWSPGTDSNIYLIVIKER